MIDINELIAIAMNIESQYSIDWGMLAIGELDCYRMIATSVLENHTMSDEQNRELIMLATIVVLTVENFALNLQLLQRC